MIRQILCNILENLVRIVTRDQFVFIFARAALAIFLSIFIFTSKYIISKREDSFKPLRQLMQVFYLQNIYFGTRDGVSKTDKKRDREPWKLKFMLEK